MVASPGCIATGNCATGTTLDVNNNDYGRGNPTLYFAQSSSLGLSDLTDFCVEGSTFVLP